MKISRLLNTSAAAIALALTTAMAANAQTVVIDDDFADGFSNLGPQQTEFYTTSSGSALLNDELTPGPIDFATGTSGRSIHALFPAQTLGTVGDSLEVIFDFTTPLSVNDGSGNDDFRFGLFDTSAVPAGTPDADRPGEDLLFNRDNNASSGTPQPGYNLLPGFFGEIDDINGGNSGDDLGIRTHDVNGTGLILTTGDTNPETSAQSGTLLNSTSGFDFISGGADNLITLLPETAYSGRLFVELISPTDFDITVEIRDALGNTIDSHTDDVSIADVIDAPTGGATQVGVNTDTFDFFGIQSTSGAFGSTSSGDTPDNGIDISRLQVISNIAVIPEPSSTALLLAGLSAMGFVRRRNS